MLNTKLLTKLCKKLYNKCRYLLAVKQMGLISKTKPNRGMLSKLIDILVDTDIVTYKPVYGMVVTLDLSDHDLNSLVDRIMGINRQILIGNIVPMKYVTKTKTRKTLDTYLSSKNGYYVDVNKSIADYTKHVKILCTIMANGDFADTGVEFRNMMLLTDLFIELRFITKALIEMRLKN